jgi:hypothetical protein
MTEQSEQELLRDAKLKAENLLAQLLARQQDLEQHVSRPQVAVGPENFAAGRRAFDRAIESTRQTLEQIDQALQTAR